MSEIGSRCFVVYKSSAGSGKTYTLVREYLRIILEHPESYRNILAITFTNKAANEMKSRIIATLRTLASGTHQNQRADIKILSEELISSTGLTNREITERSEQALRMILHDYSSFSVGTIDSFVHKLVRVFARDLGLPAAFEVELEKEKLITKTVDLLISKIGIDQTLTNILVNFIQERMEDELNWNIKIDLKQFTNKLIDEDSYLALRKLRHLKPDDFIKISGRLRKITRAFEGRLYEIARPMYDLLLQNSITSGTLYYGTRGLWGYLERISRRDFSDPLPNNNVFKTLRENKWESGQASSTQLEALYRIIPKLQNQGRQLLSLIETDYENYFLSRLIQRNIFQMAVLSELEKVMAEFRENENLVHISEFNKRIANVIQREPVPYIYERTGNRYRHFMIDEFQDTSLLQWHNLLPLLENSLSSGYLSMIVGDGKQAIYRWRNGEVAQFAALPEIYNRENDPQSLQRENLLKQQYLEKHLDKNFRSRQIIVEFNNQFFDFARKYLVDPLQKIYDQHQQVTNPLKAGGFVQIEFIREEEEVDDPEIDSLRLKRIVELVQENLVCYRPEQIAILTRTNQQASEVATYLLQNHISVVSSEALLLSSSPQVSAIIAIFRLWNNPSDRIAIATALTLLHRLGFFGQVPLHHILSQCREINTESNSAQSFEEILIASGFTYPFKHILSLPLVDRAELLIDGLYLDPHARNPYLSFFLDLLYHETSVKALTLDEFLEFWDEKGWRKPVVIPENTPSVRVMTVHKAKGLEFPVVIVPYPLKYGGNTLKEAWIEPQIKEIPELKVVRIPIIKKLEATRLAGIFQEETEKSFLDLLNLLYVAMTRAESRLYILSKDKTNKQGKWNYSPGKPDDADLLHDFLSNNYRKNSQGCFVIGQTDEKPIPSGTPTVSKTAGPLIRRSLWREKISLKLTGIPSATLNSSDPVRMGNIFHRLMSLLRIPEDLEKALRIIVAEGLILPDEAPYWREKISLWLQQDDISEYFSPRFTVFTEKEILLPDGKVLRPDRLMMDENQVYIVDYKTGDPSPAHQQQMDEYREAMLQAGFQNVHTRLIYFSL